MRIGGRHIMGQVTVAGLLRIYYGNVTLDAECKSAKAFELSHIL